MKWQKITSWLDLDLSAGFYNFGLHAAFPVLILILVVSAIQREETLKESTGT
jgi:hypothetical protein